MNCKSLHSWFSMSPVGTSKVAKIVLWMSQPYVAKQTHAYLHVLSCFPGATPALRQALQKLLEAWQSVASSQCRNWPAFVVGKASTFTDTAGDLAFKEGTKAVVHLGALQDSWSEEGRGSCSKHPFAA